MAPGPLGVPVLRSTETRLDEPVSLGPAASERASEIIDEFQNRPDEIPDDNNRQNLASLQRNMDAHEATGPAGDASVPDSVREVISSSGQSLDASIQRAVEERMGDSFGDVRIHTGPNAANACEAINARAFTVGNHIAFNSGEYDPESPEGQHLLAHELAHVRQQTGGALSMMPQANVELEIDPDPQLEREAEATAQRVMEGGELGIQRLAKSEVHVQRAPEASRRDVLTGNVDLDDLGEAVENVDTGDVDYGEVAAAGALSLVPVLGPAMKSYVDQKTAPLKLKQTLQQVDPPTEWVEQAATRAASMVENLVTGPTRFG
ncbi:DUF4157 domain-containing protein [Halovivax cerinus]|uniref:eCIS core domain-containing protein n=1 Tax=Halovivax cerinus TaxID=1487865 RepID=UPI002115328E|nr:DUF4157 domain-containing protein [Halovivax cerinus]